jgi:predicted HTH domain antitoxin
MSRFCASVRNAAELIDSIAAPTHAVSAIQLGIMRVTIQLPDDISTALQEQWDDVPRRSLEAIAVEAYRTGALTESQVRRLLGLDSRFQLYALLKEHHVPLQYTSADLEDDLRAQRELGILPNR